MRRHSLGVCLGLAAFCAAVQPASAQVIGPRNEKIIIEPVGTQGDEVLRGLKLVADGRPAEAVKVFSAVITQFEMAHDPAIPYRCTPDGDTAKRSITVVSENLGGQDFILGGFEWCAALFGKGYALIDLGRAEEAGPYLAKAVEMEPTNPTYANEYAEWLKNRREWKASYAMFERAWKLTSQDPKGDDRRPAARALRGMAFNLIELGQLDEAEALLKKSLKFEPEAKAKVDGELNYIKEARRRR